MRINSLFFGFSNAKHNTTADVSHTEAAGRSDSTDLCSMSLVRVSLYMKKNFKHDMIKELFCLCLGKELFCYLGIFFFKHTVTHMRAHTQYRYTVRVLVLFSF